ncbi:MAG: hypothetical protein RIQ62_921, partial [Bacteroidota bacterium]
MADIVVPFFTHIRRVDNVTDGEEYSRNRNDELDIKGLPRIKHNGGKE